MVGILWTLSAVGSARDIHDGSIDLGKIGKEQIQATETQLEEGCGAHQEDGLKRHICLSNGSAVGMRAFECEEP